MPGSSTGLSTDPPSNILIILSDEHDPAITGCYGHPTIQTPHIDRLAQGGVVFDNGYCNSPICSPSRMSFLTGKYIHDIGVWDNNVPLRSEEPTFANYFTAAGYETLLCGRMHMLGPDRHHGFGQRLYEDFTQHSHPGKGPRRTADAQRGSASHVLDSGPGEALFQPYDDHVTDLSRRFLQHKAQTPQGKPWLLVSGFIYPHFPLIAPHDLYDLYYPDGVVMPNLEAEKLADQHPVIQQMRYFMRVHEDLPADVVRRALAVYYGLITLTDQNIGKLVETIDNSHLRENTVVIYASDHGENGGYHGLWQKNCFYEPSVRVPMVMRVPGGRQNEHVDVPVSLVDIMPTLMDLAGIDEPNGLAGQSLAELVTGSGDPGTIESARIDPERVVFSEYHSQGMLNGDYMIRKGAYKYNYYVGYEPQLFDVSADPDELHDLVGKPAYQSVRDELHGDLLSIVDPEETNQSAKHSQGLEVAKRTSWFDWADFSEFIDRERIESQATTHNE